MLTLIWINQVSGLLSVVFVIWFLSRFCRNAWVIGLTTAGFVFSQGILNYSQAGCSYTPGVACLLLGLCLISKETTSDKQLWWNCFAAGLAFALSVGFWFLFIWALPAAILLPLVLQQRNRERLKMAVGAAISFSGFIGIFYLIVFAILRIASIAELKAWVMSAGHGNTVRGVTRLVLGVARSFINMGNDGMLMKRFLVHDPYNPVSVWQLAGLSLWKLGLFYLFLAALLWLIWKSSKRTGLLLLLAATFPVFAFAYFFSPGDIERYLAWYPFLCLAVAYSFETTSASKWVKAIPCAFFIAVLVVNFQAMSLLTLGRQQERIVARFGDLPAKLPPNSQLLAVNWQDEIVAFYRSFPFHPLNQSEAFVISSMVTLGVEDSKHWREDFAKRAQRVWAANGELWVSNRAFSQRPEADWNWVEGDDESVSWKDFSEFLANLKMGKSSGGTDGFQQVLPSEENKQFLQRLITGK
jgi:hypothetical protein